MWSVNTIITHRTNGNQTEERLVHIMGGVIIETESEKLIHRGRAERKARMLIEISLEEGLGDSAILKKLQDKIGLSSEQAGIYLAQYGKQFA